MASPAPSRSHVDTRHAILPVSDLPEDHQHLLEPFETLLYSLDDLTHEKLSLHDLIEAYSIIYLRLRTCADILCGAFSAWCREERRSRVVEQNDSFEPSSADRREVTEEDIQFARDSTDVCHHSLRVVSQILRDETLLSIFGDSIGLLVDTILDILATASLPSFDACKTHALCIWALRTQSLPARVISSRKEQLAIALQCAVKGDIFDRNDELVIDTLQAVNSSLSTHGDVLVISFHGVVSAVLPHLVSQSPVLRHEAASTLSTYCSTLLRHLRHFPEIRTLLSAQVLAFLEIQTGKSNVPPSAERLPEMLKKAMRESKTARLDDGVRNSALLDRMERALRTIKQELHGGLGVALVRTLVGPNSNVRSSDAWGVPQAISIVKDMLQTEDSAVRDDGLATLRKLLGGCHTDRSEGDLSPSWDHDGLLCGALLEGTILRIRKAELSAIVKSLRRDAVEVRQLSFGEISRYWDDLASCWITVVQSHRNASTAGLLDNDTLSVWRALLNQETRMAATDLAAKASSMVIQVLSQGFFQSPGISVDAREKRSLDFIKQHWNIMADVLSKPALQAAAASILLTVLRHSFNLTAGPVKAAWSGLCAELVAVGYPGILKTLAAKKSQGGEAELSKQMWLLIASAWYEANEKASREDLLLFLVMPFDDSSWSLSVDEIDAWNGVLGRSIAGETPAQTILLLEDVSRILLSMSSKIPLSVALKLAIALIRHMDLERATVLPAITLSFIDNVLVSSYSESESTSRQVTLDLFSIAHNQVIVAPDLLLISLLNSLEMSLILWFKDEHHVISEDEYNSMIIPLYRTILVRLEDIKPSLQIIFSLAPLLASAFTRIPPPAHGPLAFKKFFNSIYLTRGLPAKDYPEQLIVCAMTCLHCFGGEMIPGLELESQSQTSPHNVESQVVPDSQLGVDNGPHTENPSKSPLSALLGMYSSQTPVRPEFVQGSSSARVRRPNSTSKLASISASKMSQSSAFLIGHAQSQSLSSAGDRTKTTRQPGRSDASAHRPVDSGTASNDISAPPSHGSTSGLRRKRSSTASTIPPKKRKLTPPEEPVDSHVRSRSAPMTRVSSPVVNAARSRRAQPGRKVFDCVELSPYHMIRKQDAKGKGVDAGISRSRRSSVRASADAPSGSIQRGQDDHRPQRPVHKGKGKQKAAREQSSPREQYDDWETTVDTPQVMKFRKELMREQEIGAILCPGNCAKAKS
ncbi:hypothetical protein EWM64_g3095 [Hericium alpestre]|uniref:Telomere-associated protein Rif1 N-terminal domain-containing protein n=1 Tax=Hericium alpestre TaxID=135208 RepID=A0A4Z0A1E5_9AGAM|nr:hypothetical protein EWM64_g3095 [Hericium alpestre]